MAARWKGRWLMPGSAPWLKAQWRLGGGPAPPRCQPSATRRPPRLSPARRRRRSRPAALARSAQRQGYAVAGRGAGPPLEAFVVARCSEALMMDSSRSDVSVEQPFGSARAFRAGTIPHHGARRRPEETLSRTALTAGHPEDFARRSLTAFPQFDGPRLLQEQTSDEVQLPGDASEGHAWPGAAPRRGVRRRRRTRPAHRLRTRPPVLMSDSCTHSIGSPR